VHIQAITQKISGYLLPVLLGGGILYFSYHALAGNQGLAAWTQLQTEEEALKAELVELKAQRDALDQSLSRLRDGTLDLDYVEEIARTKLSYVRGDEVLVATP